MDTKAGSLLEKARKDVMAADHMASVTFKLFGDPKMLLAIADNLFVAATNAVTAALQHRLEKKEITGFNEDFDSKFRLFLKHCARPLGLEERHISVIRELRQIVAEHKKSPVEFIRGGRFVICDGEYRMKTLTIDQIRQYVVWTKEFIQKTEEAIST